MDEWDTTDTGVELTGLGFEESTTGHHHSGYNNYPPIPELPQIKLFNKLSCDDIPITDISLQAQEKMNGAGAGAGAGSGSGANGFDAGAGANGFDAGNGDVVETFKNFEIEPDIISKSPPDLLQMQYGDVVVKLAIVLTPTQVSQEPTVHWKAVEDEFYLLAMFDPDMFNRSEHTLRSFRHWMVGNIPGGDVADGDVLAEFIGPGPPKDSGLHRYVFLIYKQEGILNFDDEKRIHRTAPLKDRAPFSIQEFVTKYNLGDPVAGNFHQTKYDESVPPVLATLEAE